MKNIEQKDEKNRAEEIKAAPDSDKKREWVKPKIEDVSEQVMAQPYIRFT
jgi:hypothetical protein